MSATGSVFIQKNSLAASHLLQNMFGRLRFSFHHNFNVVSYSSQNMASGPLSGIRILDLTRVLAGPFCSMLLGDLGAEIIKVEVPGKGDDTRHWGPPFKGKESCYFLSVNRNKKSIAINMKDRKGVELIKKLASVSDVFIENFVPGKLDSFGIGYQELKKIAPRLIFCSITGYGSHGPFKNKLGYDVMAAAAGGLLHITGPENGGPCRVGVAITDVATGLYAHAAIMAALLQREKTGKGQKIDCNLLSTQISTLVNISSSYLNCGREPQRWGTAHESIVPYQGFSTSDGHIVVGAGSDQQFKELCKAMDLKHLCSDNRFSTNSLRVEHRKEIIGILMERFSKKSSDDWLQLFQECQFPCGPINAIQQAFEHPQVVHNKMVVEMSHPTEGSVKVVGPAVQYEDGGNFCRSAPPLLGQHTNHVLAEILGLSESEINELKCTHVVD